MTWLSQLHLTPNVNEMFPKFKISDRTKAMCRWGQMRTTDRRICVESRDDLRWWIKKERVIGKIWRATPFCMHTILWQRDMPIAVALSGVTGFNQKFLVDGIWTWWNLTSNHGLGKMNPNPSGKITSICRTTRREEEGSVFWIEVPATPTTLRRQKQWTSWMRWNGHLIRG